LTKTHEEVRRGPIGELAEWAAGGLRGEITVVIAGSTGARDAAPDDDTLLAEIAALVDAGTSRRDAVDRVAATYDLNRRSVYTLATARRPSS
jgi:16S rRNA (cytidine1402-2'-O)-methyltransferase